MGKPNIKQLSDKIGNLLGLNTQNKTDLVGAINENVASLNDMSKHINSFPKIVPEADDTGRLTRAFNSGYNIILEHNGNYIADSVNIYTSNLIIYGNNATITAKTKTTQTLHIGINNNGNVINTNNIKIEDLNFIGIQDNWIGSDVSSGINIRDNQLFKNGGSTNIKIKNCNFSKHTFGIIATGTTGLTVEKCYSTNNFYSQPLGAGGYGILIQSCFDVNIANNKFKAVAGDRHAIYISCVPAQNVPNENVILENNIIDWSGVSPITNFETCIMIRSTKKLIIKNNIGIGGYGGLDLEPSNGILQDVLIDGNSFTDILHLNNDRAGITVAINNNSITQNLKIVNNTFTSQNAGIHGMSVANVTNCIIENNICDSPTIGLDVYRCTNITISNNQILNSSYAGIFYQDTNSNIIINHNSFINSAKEIVYSTSVINGIRHNYERNALIRGTGSGLLAVTDEHGIISSLSTDSNGVKITFTKLFAVKQGLIKTIFNGSNQLYTYNRGSDVNSNYVIIGIKDFNNYDKDLSTLTIDMMIMISQ